MITVAATFTAEPLGPPLKFWLRTLGLESEVSFAPFNQIFQQLLDLSSLLHDARTSASILLIRRSDLGPNEQAVQQNMAELSRSVQSFVERSRRPLLVFACPPDDARLAMEWGVVSPLNIVTSAEILASYRVVDVHDEVAARIAAIPYSEEFFASLATFAARRLYRDLGRRCKAIVADCDGTLWGGVLGEDGTNGVRLEARHLAVQNKLAALERAGVLLCLCTKNEESDVRVVFEQRRDMPLRPNQIAAIRANWRPKSENVVDLANELQFELAALAMIDDSPIECAEIRNGCPEVAVLELPSDDKQIDPFLDHCWILDERDATEEDNRRTAFYDSERERRAMLANAPTFDEFLASLQLEVAIEPLQEANVSRAAQLTQRTTQFNIRPEPRRAPEIRELTRSGKREFFSVCVRDRFGDYGMAGLIGLRQEGSRIILLDLMVSCRALGRGVEHRMVNFVGALAEARGCSTVAFRLEHTARNRPAADFLSQFGTETALTVLMNARVKAPQPTGSRVDGTARSSGAKTIQPDWTAIASLRDARSILAFMGIESTVEPRTSVGELAQELRRIWAEVFQMEAVATDADFFDLGGNSLIATQIASRAARRLDAHFDIEDIFDAGTVANLVKRIESRAPNVRSAAVAS